MDLGLDGRAALVLGSSGGLGAATALEFAREGAHVTLFGRRPDALEGVAARIRESGGVEPAVVVGDVTEPSDIQRAVDRTVAGAGRLDVLFNNSGGPPAGAFDEIDDDQWTAAFHLTLLSYVRTVRACLPHLRAAGGGWIMNNTTSGVRAPLPSLILSNVFRMGVVGLTGSLASELGPDAILVNAVAPGRIATDRVAAMDEVRAARTGSDAGSIRRATEAGIALRRYGTAEEFARTVVYHCSPANTYITGQTLLVDGGLVKGY